MKKLHLILSASAILFALTATFATQKLSSQIGYEWKEATEQCVNRGSFDCSTNAGNPCTIEDGAIILGSSNVIANECGPQLNFQE